MFEDGSSGLAVAKVVALAKVKVGEFPWNLEVVVASACRLACFGCAWQVLDQS